MRCAATSGAPRFRISTTAANACYSSASRRLRSVTRPGSSAMSSSERTASWFVRRCKSDRIYAAHRISAGARYENDRPHDAQRRLVIETPTHLAFINLTLSIVNKINTHSFVHVPRIEAQCAAKNVSRLSICAAKFALAGYKLKIFYFISMSNDILAPHRCVGQVFGHVAAAYTPIPKSRNRGFISVPINNCVYTYKIEPFRLVWVSEPLRSTILVIARDRHRVFAADKSGIDVLNVSGMRIARFPHQSVSSKLRFIVPIGEVLVAIEDDGLINVYDLKTQLLAVEFEAPASSEITAALHPDTWFNEARLFTSFRYSEQWVTFRSYSQRAMAEFRQ